MFIVFNMNLSVHTIKVITALCNMLACLLVMAVKHNIYVS